MGKPGAPLTLATLTALALVVAGCGDDAGGEGATGTTAAEDESSTTNEAEGEAPSTTAPPTPEEQVLFDYGNARDAINVAANPPNPEHPELLKYWTGDSLAQVQSTFTQWKGLNIGAQSTVEVDAEVISIAGDVAVVVDCFVDTTQMVDLATGRAAGAPEVTTQHTDVRLERSEGVWKIGRQEKRQDPCTPS